MKPKLTQANLLKFADSLYSEDSKGISYIPLCASDLHQEKEDGGLNCALGEMFETFNSKLYWGGPTDDRYLRTKKCDKYGSIKEQDVAEILAKKASFQPPRDVRENLINLRDTLEKLPEKYKDDKLLLEFLIEYEWNYFYINAENRNRLFENMLAGLIPSVNDDSDATKELTECVMPNRAKRIQKLFRIIANTFLK